MKFKFLLKKINEQNNDEQTTNLIQMKLKPKENKTKHLPTNKAGLDGLTKVQ